MTDPEGTRVHSHPKDTYSVRANVGARQNGGVQDEDILWSSSSSLGLMPRLSECKRDEVVLKLNSNAEWQIRRLIISKDKLLIANADQNLVTDQIPLVLIELIAITLMGL